MTPSEKLQQLLEQGREVQVRLYNDIYFVRLRDSRMLASGGVSRKTLKLKGPDSVLELLNDLERLLKEAE